MSGLTHAFVSGKAAPIDTTKIGGPNWDAAHLFTGGSVGDILTVGAANAIAALSDVATGSVLVSGGVGAAPAWSASPSLTGLTLGTALAATSGGTGFGTYAVGDILYASATNALSKLADVAAGSVMVSGGANTAPAWSATPSITSLTLASAGTLAWSTDLFLQRDAANTIAQRNSTTSQVARIYNTFTSSTSYERLAIDWTNVANRAILSVEKGSGGGTQRSLGLMADVLYFYTGAGTSVIQPWQMTAAGHLLATTDATYDIGASNTTRPNNLYVATRVTCDNVLASTAIALTNVGGSGFKTSNGGFMIFQSDGVLKFSDNANTSFGRLQFGGTTSSFPALARNGVGLEVKLADASGFSTLKASYLVIGDGVTAPGAGTSEARIYVDTADGDLKIVYADGVVKTIVVDT